MKKLGFILILMLVAVPLLVAGCGGGEEEATPTPTATETPGETPTPTATEPVHFNELVAFLPGAPSGWEADDPHGAAFQLQEWAWSQASGDYTNQTTDEYVSALIYDSAYYYGFGWFQVWEMAFQMETAEMYLRSTTVDGYPAWESWYDPDDYALMVLVADRFMIAVSAETEASLDQFSDLIDYDGIAALD